MTRSPACALLDRLSWRGLRVVLRNNRLWILPAKAYALVPDADRAAIRAHRPAIKDLIRGGYVPTPVPVSAPDPLPLPAPAPSPRRDPPPLLADGWEEARRSVAGRELSEADVLAALALEGDEEVDAYRTGRLSKTDAYDRAYWHAVGIHRPIRRP